MSYKIDPYVLAQRWGIRGKMWWLLPEIPMFHEVPPKCSTQNSKQEVNMLEENKHHFIIPVFPAESKSGIVFYLSHQEPEILDDANCIFLSAR